MWSCKARRGRKIRAKVGGISEGVNAQRTKTKTTRKGKGKLEG